LSVEFESCTDETKKQQGRQGKFINLITDHLENSMQVRILIGANAYAHIKTETSSLDVLLAAGKSPKASLIESSIELREKALRLMRQADLMEEASKIV
jgi:hypothetical protein